MIFFLIVVLVAIVFGFVFAKLDTLTKASKIMHNEIVELQEEIAELRKNDKDK